MSEERLRKDINRLKQLTNGCIPEFHQDIEDVLDRFEQLKEVIEEVRQLVNNSKLSYLATSNLPDDLLQILDKVKVDNERPN